MGVYGESRWPASEDTVVTLDEHLPLLPGDIYGWTKMAGEELCKLYGRTHGIPSVALRYGMFVPESFFRYGIRLLYGGVDTHDVGRSVMASIEALTSGRIMWDAFNVESVVPFNEEDGPQLRRDPCPCLTRITRAHRICCTSGGGDPRPGHGVLPDAACGGGARLSARLQLRPVAGGTQVPT